MDEKQRSYVSILLAAFFFGISTPVAKLLIIDISPIALAGLLYLGAFLGLSLFNIFKNVLSFQTVKEKTDSLTLIDLPWLIGAIISGGILAPIFLMIGLSRVSGFTASLMLNLEGLATVILAILFFHESAGGRIWTALA